MQELKKEDVKKVIEGRSHGDHTPMLYDMWIYPWIYEERREAFEKFMDAQIKDVDFVDLVMPDIFHAPEGGLDVLHPIQKYTMDYREIARKYGDRICLLVGFDVQQTIPFGTPEEVRQEVRELVDIFSRPDGRFMLTMGNGSTLDWKLESLEALYDETKKYQKHWKE